MKTGVDIIGAGEGSTILNGDVNFTNADGAEISNLTVKDKILVDHSDNVAVSVEAADNCFVEELYSDLSLTYFMGGNSVSCGVYAHNYSDVDMWYGGDQEQNSGCRAGCGHLRLFPGCKFLPEHDL